MYPCGTNVEMGGVWRVNLPGPCLDDLQVAELRHTLQRGHSAAVRGIVVDLQRIDRIAPLGLAGLAMLPGHCPPPIRLALASLQPRILEIALHVHLHDILDIYEDARAAEFDMSTPLGLS